MMLMLRPDLVDERWRALPPATYSLPERLVPDYPLKRGGQGYVGHPSLADPVFAKATCDVLVTEAMALVDALLDRRLGTFRRAPFSKIPLLRTNFWPVAAATGFAVAALAWLRPRR